MNLIELSKLEKRIRKLVKKWRVNNNNKLRGDIEKLLLDYVKGQCGVYRIMLTPETIDDYCNKIVSSMVDTVLNTDENIERLCIYNLHCDCGRTSNCEPVRVFRGFPICNNCYNEMIPIEWWEIY